MALTLRHLTRLAFGLLLCVQTPLLHGQTPPSAAKEDRSFTVYAPVTSPAWDRLYYMASPKTPVKLVFQGNRRSAPVKVAGAAKPLVFAVETIDPATQKKSYAPVAETVLPESAAKSLVVFTVSAGDTLRIQTAAVDDGLNAFPLRSVRFFNVTGVPLLGKAAGFQGEVPPGISPAHPYPVASENPDIVGVFPLAFGINDPKAGPRLLYNGNADAWPLARSLVFILPPRQGSDNVQLRVLVDAPPPAKKE